MKVQNIKWLDATAVILVVLGALNWGLWGVLDIDGVVLLLGATMAAKVVYTLIGLGGIYVATMILPKYLESKKK